MSTPARQFENLCINTEMPTTRRQAQRLASARAPEVENPLTGSDGDGSNDETGGPSQQSRSRAKTSQAKGKQPARSESSASSTDSSPSGITSRAYKTRDILSTFDVDVLPEEIQPELFKTIGTARTPAQCLRATNLEATILLLAVNNHAVYKSLSKAQPAAKRAIIFFQKAQSRGSAILKEFDDYASDGISPELYLTTQPSVRELGDRLQSLVDIIRDAVDERHPHGVDQAARSLLFLLEKVCNRNYDAFENNVWGRRPPRGEGEDDRNLFQCLIRDAPVRRAPFALAALKALPKAVLASTDIREKLAEIRGSLHAHQAPVAYRDAFQKILESLEVATSPVAGPQPGQKRPAPGSGRGERKRTK